jgi:Txe/YoeB family toxin of toxin-antitoxin system
MYKIQRIKQAKKDMEVCIRAGFEEQLNEIRKTVKRDPYENSQGFERLKSNLKGYCSRKIGKGNRFLYSVHKNTNGIRDENGNLYDGIIIVHESREHNYKKPKKIIIKKD